MKIPGLKRCKCDRALKPHWDYKGYCFMRLWWLGRNPVFEIHKGTSDEVFHRGSDGNFDMLDEAFAIRGCVEQIEKYLKAV